MGDHDAYKNFLSFFLFTATPDHHQEILTCQGLVVFMSLWRIWDLLLALQLLHWKTWKGTKACVKLSRSLAYVRQVTFCASKYMDKSTQIRTAERRQARIELLDCSDSARLHRLTRKLPRKWHSPINSLRQQCQRIGPRWSQRLPEGDCGATVINSSSGWQFVSRHIPLRSWWASAMPQSRPSMWRESTVLQPPSCWKWHLRILLAWVTMFCVCACV